ncbi:MAG: FkbM family methyltransferase [Candidatus Nomurabacteria bacterium]|nr:FkbM family methyltransferase [Candidatus Nomurabacteria bacterium]
MNDFAKYKKNITSQWGEDGIITEIFKRIGVQEKFCIEFGAWDGKHLSNVWNLWHEMKWSALLIEGDKNKCRDLEQFVSDFPKVKPYCTYVEAEGINSLDKILEKTFPNKIIDILSIDIDGNDYYIFESLKAKPRVIIIEYNPTIPLHIDLVQKTDEYFGASALSMYKLAHSKGYKLVTMTETNFFLINDNEFKKLGINEPALEDIFSTDNLTYIMTAYDGTPALTKIPTYHNIIKRTERELHFNENEFITINLKKYKQENLLIKLFLKLLNKVSLKIDFYTNKNNIDLQSKRVIPWFKINGDKTLRLDYPLNSSSVVVDVGGYEGQWASDIFAKYNSDIIIFEPVKQFAQQIEERFSKNNKITCYNVGLSNIDKTEKISLLDDSSSLFKNNTQLENITLVNTNNFFEQKNINSIDLIKINIEGGEYDLLENLIENKLISKIKNIQVQFHDFVPNAKERMANIQEKLKETHHTTYQYEFVWENWERNN